MAFSQECSLETILNVLPQTQCGQCGFAGCRPYAAAIAAHEAPINLCPPGGLATLKTLAERTNQAAESLVPALTARITAPQVARIIEQDCIGCTKCLQACPVDAIYGAAKQMHVVLTDACTGCGLCVEPCPVDCIEMRTVDKLRYDPQTARKAYEQKLERGDFRRAGSLALSEKTTTTEATADRKRLIANALARAKIKNHAPN